MKPALLPVASLVLALLLLTSYSGAPGPASAATFSGVSAGEPSSCALTAPGGAVKCWGRNVEGQLGIGTTSAPYTQSAVPLPVCASGVWNGTACNGGSTFAGVYALSSGSSAGQTCGTVIYLIIKCWGRNSSGQVGNGTTTTPVVNPSMVQCQGISSYCSGILGGIVGIAAANAHTCALDYAGYVWCWGRNNAGQLGDGTTTNRSYATRVCATGSGQDCTTGTLLSGVAAITAGSDFTCALTTSGGTKCWGRNAYGQLGDGTTTNHSLPADVSGLTSGVASISAGHSHACVVLTGGGAKCWGLNLDAALGDGTRTNRTTPVPVCAAGYWDGAGCHNGIALSGVSKISAGGGHTCVIRTSSPYVQCWGSQAFGQLGNSVQSYTAYALNPVSWTGPSWGQPQPAALSAGGAHTCVIIATYAECWGWNPFGQLGNGTMADTTTWVGQDTDKDGCTDAQELGPNHAYGGQRDHINFWDFFDTPDATNVRDKKVDSADYNRINARYFSDGDATIDPLSPPPAAPAYHPAFDRQDDPNSSEAWDLIGPDGHIRTADMSLLNSQLNDSCQ